MKGKLIFGVVGFLLVLLGVTYYLLAKSGKVETVSLAKPSVSLSPSKGSHKVGETFDIDILVNTGGKIIDGVDIFYLNYNPKILEVVDADETTAGVQIKNGNLFPMYLGNLVDASAGRISLSGLVNTGNDGYKGSGTLATIRFKAKEAGDANLFFDYSANSTKDTNMVEHGTAQDILGKAAGGNYNIGAK